MSYDYVADKLSVNCYSVIQITLEDLKKTYSEPLEQGC